MQQQQQFSANMNASPSLWQAGLPREIRDKVNVLQSSFPKHVPVVVVGAGLTGCSMAYHLSQRGVACLVLESKTLGGGATGRNGGIMYPASEFEKDTVSDMNSKFDLKNSCDLVQHGGLQLSLSEPIAGLPNHAQSLATSDTDVDRITSLLERNGFKMSAINPTKCEFGGEDEIGSVWSTKVVYEIASAAQPMAQFVERAQVVSFNEKSVEFMFENNSYAIEFEQIIIATNAWTSQLLPEIGMHLKPCVNCVVASAEPVPDHLRWSFSVLSAGDDKAASVYCSMGMSGYLVVGGLRSLAPDEGIGRDSDIEGAPGDEQIFKSLNEFILGVNPDLYEAIQLTRCWVGVLTTTTDRLPIIGKLPNHMCGWVAAGFNGHGMTRCFGAARLVVSKLLEEFPSLKRDGENPTRSDAQQELDSTTWKAWNINRFKVV